MGTDKVFNVGGKSFIWIMTRKGPGIKRNYHGMNAGKKYFDILNKKIHHLKYYIHLYLYLLFPSRNTGKNSIN
jgi:hypothetical protein